MNLASAIQHRVFNVIQAEAEKLGVEVFVIGGFVRDVLLQKRGLNQQGEINFQSFFSTKAKLCELYRCASWNLCV